MDCGEVIAFGPRQGSALSPSHRDPGQVLQVALPREALYVCLGDSVKAALVALGSSAF